jgi:hypothetical protein
MFDAQISFYKSLSASSVSIPLIKWIDLNQSKNQYNDLIFNYRRTGDSDIKKSLPLATVGGTFKGGRKLENLLNRTGWLAIDIDHKDNLHLPSAERIRDEVSKISYVAYSCLSVSGKGVWCLIKISDPAKQALHFEQLKTDFKSKQIVLDPTKGKNANDARFLSYDPNAILKKHFKVYDRLPVKTRPKRKLIGHIENSTIDIPYIIAQVQSKRLDIAPDYETYRNIGFALADEYGERGRDVFHELVCYSPKYDFKQADVQYTKCLQSNGKGITIGSLIHYCNTNDIQTRK